MATIEKTAALTATEEHAYWLAKVGEYTAAKVTKNAEIDAAIDAGENAQPLVAQLHALDAQLNLAERAVERKRPAFLDEEQAGLRRDLDAAIARVHEAASAARAVQLQGEDLDRQAQACFRRAVELKNSASTYEASLALNRHVQQHGDRGVPSGGSAQ
jgi:hypothetical protein